MEKTISAAKHLNFIVNNWTFTLKYNVENLEYKVKNKN